MDTNVNNTNAELENKKNAAAGNVREALELARMLADGDLFQSDNAKNCHAAIIDALNALKLIERATKAQEAIEKARRRAAEALAKLGF